MSTPKYYKVPLTLNATKKRQRSQKQIRSAFPRPKWTRFIIGGHLQERAYQQPARVFYTQNTKKHPSNHGRCTENSNAVRPLIHLVAPPHNFVLSFAGACLELEFSPDLAPALLDQLPRRLRQPRLVVIAPLPVLLCSCHARAHGTQEKTSGFLRVMTRRDRAPKLPSQDMRVLIRPYIWAYHSSFGSMW